MNEIVVYCQTCEGYRTLGLPATGPLCCPWCGRDPERDPTHYRGRVLPYPDVPAQPREGEG